MAQWGGLQSETPLGQIIFGAYQEMWDYNGKKGLDFDSLLFRALLMANLPGSFRRWAMALAQDKDWVADRHCNAYILRGFHDKYVNPGSEEHRKCMKCLKEWKDDV